MSYEIVRKMSINRTDLEVKLTSASNNVRDWMDCLVFEDTSIKFKTYLELEDYMVIVANEVLGGQFRLPRTHAINRRLIYLKEAGLLEYASSTNEKWLQVKDTQEVRDILTGKTRIHAGWYTITNGHVSVKKNRATYKLQPVRLPATKFLSKAQAEDFMKEIPDWVEKYNLEVWEVKAGNN